MASTGKKISVKKNERIITRNGHWSIHVGELKRPRGRPDRIQSLFKFIGEKIPFEFIDEVRNDIENTETLNGVYIAHDSMGYPRYVGRGRIFARLKHRKAAQVLELSYFSFCVVENKKHEREIETIMIRSAGPLLDFNDRKVRLDIQPGDIRDFEPGTRFVERQMKRGRKRTTRRKQS